jgi:iron complex outermembrane recepter protein
MKCTRKELDTYVSVYGSARRRLVLPALGLLVQICLILVFAKIVSGQSPNTLSGIVRDTQSGVIGGAVVRLKGSQATSLETTTKEDGTFEIQGLASGSYEVQVIRTGFEPLRQAVDWQGTATPLEFTLRAGTLRQAITVSEDVGEGYLQPETQIATRSLTPLRDLPQAVTVVTRETLNDQQAFRFTDLYRNAAGVNAFSHYNDFTARGFRSGDGNVMINGQQGSGFNWHVPMAISNVERVEVIKGPASLLFGNGQPGGTVSLITKKPLADPHYELRQTVGSFQTHRTQIDVTGPLLPSRSLLYRLNVGGEHGNSFRDFTGYKNALIAPALTWRPDSRTSLTVETEHIYDDRTVGWDRGIVVPPGANALTLPIERFLHEPDDFDINKGTTLGVSFQRLMGENFLINGQYRGAWRREDNGYHQPRPLLADGRTLPREYRDWHDNNNAHQITAYANAEPEIFGMRHRLTMGVDGNRFDRQYFYQVFRPNGGVPSIDIFAPQYRLANPSTYRNPIFNDIFNARTDTVRFFVQDQIDLLPKLKLMVGLGYNRYDYSQVNFAQLTNTRTPDASTATAFVPRAGLVYQPTATLSLYGSFSESFLPQYSNLPEQGGPFDPERGRQVEVGAKKEWWGGRLLGTLALYRIVKQNVLNPDPIDPVRQVQTGEVTAKGVEFDLTGRITQRLSVVANYAFNDTAVTRDTTGLVGNKQPNAPKHLGGGWLRQELGRGLAAAVGLRSVSWRTTFDTTLRIPSYTVLDASVFWRYRFLDLTAGVNNLADERYVLGAYNRLAVFPGAPRNVLVTLAFRR